jgi:CBS domain containing-hemolysin-like protein
MDILVVILLSLSLSGFFSGMEIAFISANKLKIELDLKSESLFSKYLSNVFKSPSRFIATMLVGNNIALVVYGISMSQLLEPYFAKFISSSVVLLLIQTVISTLVILVTAEFLPKVIFRIHSNKLLKLLALPLVFFFYLLYPIVSFALSISKFFMNLMGVNLMEASPMFGKVDIEEYLSNYYIDKDSQDHDVEVQILQNALDFSKVKVRECMIHRTEIIGLDLSSSIVELKNKFTSTKLSKIVIYNQNIDQVIGYAHSYDLFKNPKDIKSILLPIPIVTETMLANELLELFIERRKAIAVVVDEFGGTSGIVTIEDVMEEIFGEIEDEHDIEQEYENQIDEHKFVFSARLEVDYLNHKYNFDLEISDEYETIAGYLLSHLEEIPEQGTIVEIDKYIFTIDKVSDSKIEKIMIEKS